MTAGIVAGAILGAGVFLFVVALLPRRVSLARQLATFDSRPAAAVRPARLSGESESEFSRKLGVGLAACCSAYSVF